MFTVQTYSNYENQAKKNLEEQVRLKGLQDQDLIGEILIPMEQVVEMVNGEKKTTRRKLFPGYIFVQMELNDITVHLVKNTSKVTGSPGVGAERAAPAHVGPRGRSASPWQVTEGAHKPKPKVQFETSDTVRVIDGPFANFNGTVEEVNPEKGRVRVLRQHLRSCDPRGARLHAGGEDQPARQRSSAPGVTGRRSGRGGRVVPSGGPVGTTLSKGSSPPMKKVTGQVKLQIPAGKANPAPPIGPALGQQGVNIMEFCKQFNAKTQAEAKEGLIIPVIITVYQDRSFTFILKTPPAAVLHQEGGGPAHREEEGLGRARSRARRRWGRSPRSSSRTSPR